MPAHVAETEGNHSTGHSVISYAGGQLLHHSRATEFLHSGTQRPLNQPRKRAVEKASEAIAVCACGMSDALIESSVDMVGLAWSWFGR